MRLTDEGKYVPFNVVSVEFQKAKRETIIPDYLPPVDAPKPGTRSADMLGYVLVVLIFGLGVCVGVILR
jgi:hypothetical protein